MSTPDTEQEYLYPWLHNVLCSFFFVSPGSRQPDPCVGKGNTAGPRAGGQMKAVREHMSSGNQPVNNRSGSAAIFLFPPRC